MTPEHIMEIAKTIGPSAAILLYMWINRAPVPKEAGGDPAKQVLDLLRELQERQIDMYADLQILKDRRPR